MTKIHATPLNVLLLGGTTEATALAGLLAADPRFSGTLSLAGRTANPVAAPIPVRMGGFGGVEGLASYIKTNNIGVVIDATHPFAAQISANAVLACQLTHCPLIALERPPWQQQPDDNWETHGSVEAAIAALPDESTVVFSGLGRLLLGALRAAPQHHYIIRLIDPPVLPLELPHSTLVLGRGPFKTADDTVLFRVHGVQIVLAKNAGSRATVSKIEAARALGLKVMMIDRPTIPVRHTFETVEAVWQELQRVFSAHDASPISRGV